MNFLHSICPHVHYTRTIHTTCTPRAGNATVGLMSRVARVELRSWREQGRFALIWQKCQHRELFDVRVTVIRNRKGWKASGLQNDPTFEACARLARDKPKTLSLEEQATAFQMVVCIEGNGGWADRLRHLLLSGMVVLKQATLAQEWFEPLLVSWRHYVPVSSSLHNLSDAVLWVRANPAKAIAIAEAGAQLIEEIMTTDALQAYTAKLFQGYAALYYAGGTDRVPQSSAGDGKHPKKERGGSSATAPSVALPVPLQPPLPGHARFGCAASGNEARCTFSTARRPSAMTLARLE